MDSKADKTIKKPLKRNLVVDSDTDTDPEYRYKLPLRRLKISEEVESDTSQINIFPKLLECIKELKEEMQLIKNNIINPKANSKSEKDAEKEAKMSDAANYAKKNSNLKAAKLFKVDESTIRRWRKISEAKSKKDKECASGKTTNDETEVPQNEKKELLSDDDHKEITDQEEKESNRRKNKSYFVDAEVI